MVREGRQRTIVGASASLFVSRLLAGFLSYLGTAAVARVLSPDGWGAFTFVTSITSLIAFLFDFQVSRMVLVEILDAEEDAGEIVGAYMTLRFLLGLAAYLATLAFVLIGGYSTEIFHATVIGGLTLLLTPTWNGLFLFFQSRHWLRSVATVNLVSRCLLLACFFGLLAAGFKTLLPYMMPILVSETFLLVTLTAIALRHIRLRPSLQWKRWTRWTREAIPITLGYAIGSLYYRLDTVMLSQLDTLKAVGLYGIGYKFSDLIAFLPAAVLAPVFTLLVQAWPDNPEAFRRTVRAAWIILLTCAFGLATVLTIFAEPLIVVLYGHTYAEAANSARLVIAGQGVRFFTMLCVTILISVNRNFLYAMAAVIGLLLNVALDVVLIPRYSYGGAAFATIATEVVVLGVLVYAVNHVPHASVFPWAAAGRVVLATAALAITAAATDLVVPWPIAAALGGVVFAATLHTIGLDGPGGLRVVPSLLQPVSE